MEGPVLVTGATGFVGSHVADLLSASGVSVRALVRPTSDTRHLAALPDLELVEGDLEDPASLERAVAGTRAVIHAAGLVKARPAEAFHRVNALGTASLLAAARAMGRSPGRFVHVSSLAARGASHDGLPLPGDAPSRPVTAYGRSKLAAEEEVRGASAALHTVILRPAVVHGPRDRETLAFFRAVKLGVLPLTGAPGQRLSVVYATDLAHACLLALDTDVPSGTVYDIEDGDTPTLGTMVEHIEAALGTRVKVRVPIPGPVLLCAAVAAEAAGAALGHSVMLTRDKVRELRAPHWVSDAGPARAALGWAPRVDFAEGARRSATWYREAGWL